MAFAAKGSPEALTSVTYNGSAVRAIWKFEILSVCGKCLVPSPQWHFSFVKLSFVYKMLLVQEAQPRLGIMKHFVSFTQTVIYFWRSLPILFSIWQSKIVDLVERWLVRGKPQHFLLTWFNFHSKTAVLNPLHACIPHQWLYIPCPLLEIAVLTSPCFVPWLRLSP